MVSFAQPNVQFKLPRAGRLFRFRTFRSYNSPYNSGRFAGSWGSIRTSPEGPLYSREASVQLRKVRWTVGKLPYSSGRYAGPWGSFRTSPEGPLYSREASVHLRKVRWIVGKHPYTDHKNTRSRKPEASENGFCMVVSGCL